MLGWDGGTRSSLARALTRLAASARETRMRLPNWVRLPGRTVRVRLTVLYAILFLVSGALLLAIASGVTVHAVSSSVVSPAGGLPTQPGHTDATRIQMLQSLVNRLQSQVAVLQSQVGNQPGQNQLGHALFLSSVIALAIMTIASTLLGWLIAGRGLRPGSQMTP